MKILPNAHFKVNQHYPCSNSSVMQESYIEIVVVWRNSFGNKIVKCIITVMFKDHVLFPLST